MGFPELALLDYSHDKGRAAIVARSAEVVGVNAAHLNYPLATNRVHVRLGDARPN